MFNINKVRADFPILSREVYGKPLVYLDNAATTQKPLMVLDAMRDEYLNVNANVHRGVHYLSLSRLPIFMRLPVRRCARSSMPRRSRKSSLRVVRQKRSIWWLPRSANRRCRLAMRSSSQRWNTTPISYLGSFRR